MGMLEPTSSFLVREVSGGVQFAVRVQPGARREGVVGQYGDAVKIAISAPAVDGKANEALVRCVAALAGVPRASVAIVAGATSRTKVLRIEGITSPELLRALAILV